MIHDAMPGANLERDLGYGRDPTRPLVPQYRERFARAFVETHRPEEAARKAGYGRHAPWVWVELLKNRAVQARLDFLTRSPDPPPMTKTSLLDTLRQMASMDFSNLYCDDPHSDGKAVDLSRATPEQLSTLDFKQTIVEENGQVKRTTMITKPDRMSFLKPLLIHHSILRPGPETDEQSEFLKAARAIRAASPPLDPAYMKANLHRLDELDERSD